MKNIISFAGALSWLLILTSTAAPAQQTQDPVVGEGSTVVRVTFPPGRAPRVADGIWTDRVVGIPGENAWKAAPRLALPSFSSSIVARGKLYRFTMVGANPSLRNARKATIPVQIIPVRLEFPDGTVLDPSAPSSGCAGSGTPLALDPGITSLSERRLWRRRPPVRRGGPAPGVLGLHRPRAYQSRLQHAPVAQLGALCSHYLACGLRDAVSALRTPGNHRL